MRKTTNHIEDQWVSNFREGREQGLTEVFNNLYPALCWYSERITKDKAGAQDIVQEAFLKIWEKHHQFSHWMVLKSYLYTTVRHDSSRWFRRKQRIGIQEQTVVEIASSPTSNALQDLIRAEVYRQLQAGVDTLPTQCRQVVTLLFMEGKSTREVADTLQVSQATVKVQKGRGLRLLRHRLANLFVVIVFTLIAFTLLAAKPSGWICG